MTYLRCHRDVDSVFADVSVGVLEAGAFDEDDGVVMLLVRIRQDRHP